MNHYEIVVELTDATKTYQICAIHAYEAFNQISERLTKENISFNIINLTKRDTNYCISEAV